MYRLVMVAALGSVLAGCGAARDPRIEAAGTAAASRDAAWRSAIRLDDAAALEQLPATWAAARTRLTRTGRAAAVREGALLDPAAALPHPEPTPGSYRCRLVKLGKAATPTGLRAFPSFFCYIQGTPDGGFTFTKQTGSDLPGGALYPDGDTDMVFLGATQAAGVATPARYGDAPTGNLVGRFERIAPFRWRLVMPAAADTLAIYEVTPVPVEQQPPATGA